MAVGIPGVLLRPDLVMWHARQEPALKPNRAARSWCAGLVVPKLRPDPFPLHTCIELGEDPGVP